MAITDILNLSRSEKVRHKLMVVENGTVIFSDVHSVRDGQIESDFTMLPEASCTRFMDVDRGGLLYVANLDLPAKIEAENLKKLRRSAVLSKLFSYDREKGFDWFKFLPYFIIILMVLFKHY